MWINRDQLTIGARGIIGKLEAEVPLGHIKPPPSWKLGTRYESSVWTDADKSIHQTNAFYGNENGITLFWRGFHAIPGTAEVLGLVAGPRYMIYSPTEESTAVANWEQVHYFSESLVSQVPSALIYNVVAAVPHDGGTADIAPVWGTRSEAEAFKRSLMEFLRLGV